MTDGWATFKTEVRRDLLDELRRGPVAGVDDLDACEALAMLLQSEFMSYGTGGGERLNDPDVRLALRSLRALCARLGAPADVPWLDFSSFRSYWLAHDGYGSWAARIVASWAMSSIPCSRAYTKFATARRPRPWSRRP